MTTFSNTRARIAAARAAGVNVVFGSDLYIDFGMPRGAAVLLALQAYVDGGMSPAEAIRSATYLAGERIAPGKIGRLAPGSYADLIAVEGDPTQTLAVLGKVRCVMLEGRLQATAYSDCRHAALP